MAKSGEFSSKITKENLSKILETIRDLSSIDDKVHLIIDKKNTLMYSMVGSKTGINAFKSFIYPTMDIFQVDEFEETINFIIRDAKGMYRNLRIMTEFNETVNCKMTFEELGNKIYADKINFKCGSKLKLNFYSGDPTTQNTGISVDKISNYAKIENANFNFDLKATDYLNIKKLSTPDNESEILYMNTTEKEGQYYVSIGESTWDLTLSEIDYNQSRTMAFPKKYFKTITMAGESAKIYIFDAFMMVSNNNSNLLVSTEVTI